MTNSPVSPSKEALRVAQQAVWVLAKWAGAELSKECRFPDDSLPTTRAKEILKWPPSKDTLKPLRLLFDRVDLSGGQNKQHYWEALAIADTHPLIPYPQEQHPSDLEPLKQDIQKALNPLTGEDWENLSLLTLILEKFGSHLGFGESDVALVDLARTTGAIAAAHNESNQLSLVAGDLSGIQNFIYTISSEGALKSLRARSFYLELVAEEIVGQLLAKLELPRTNVIYAGGGNLYLLAPGTKQTVDLVTQVRHQLNKWLLATFQGKIFLALDCLTFDAKSTGNQEFARHWENVTKNLSKQKAQKFRDQLDQLLDVRRSYEPCSVCHRNDVETLQPLKDDANAVMVCDTCRQMFELGGKLLGVEAIVRSREKHIPGEPHTISFEIPATAEIPTANIYYHLFPTWKQIVKDSDTVLLVNDWTVEHYKFRQFRNPVPLLLGNYGKESEEEEGGFMSAGEMTEKAEEAGCIPRVGYLRMDVDRLGQIFAKGLGENQTLPRIAGLSRQMSYFFKVYLNSIAKSGNDNISRSTEKDTFTYNPRPNLLFIYAGGDDLFISGAWNEVVAFGFEVYRRFRDYTGTNPDITLSGGISIEIAKFPVYQAAKTSEEAEKKAKNNDRDSLGLFGEVFKWGEWLGTPKEEIISLIDESDKTYLQEREKIMPELLGVLPFVKRLDRLLKLETDYPRSFIRNLLATAEMQEQMLDAMKKGTNQYRDTRYYLHLPKLVYTLTRLPRRIRSHADFEQVRTSLKNPYNAPYFRAIATWIEFLNRT